MKHTDIIAALITDDPDVINEATADDLKKGFDAMRSGAGAAGRQRTQDLIAKQGYASFSSPEAVKQFRAQYPNYVEKVVGSEHRFYPPAQPAQAQAAQAQAAQSAPQRYFAKKTIVNAVKNPEWYKMLTPKLRDGVVRFNNGEEIHVSAGKMRPDGSYDIVVEPLP